jgi:hypothetical protein
MSLSSVFGRPDDNTSAGLNSPLRFWGVDMREEVYFGFLVR